METRFGALMPTVISTSAIYNSIIAGARKACEGLGGGYTTLVQSDGYFSNAIKVYGPQESRPIEDELSVSQSVESVNPSLWGFPLKIESLGETNHRGQYSSHELFAEAPARYFFADPDGAAAYLEGVSARTEEQIYRVVEALADSREEDN